MSQVVFETLVVEKAATVRVAWLRSYYDPSFPLKLVPSRCARQAATASGNDPRLYCFHAHPVYSFPAKHIRVRRTVNLSEGQTCICVAQIVRTPVCH